VPPSRVEIIEHTADVALRIRADRTEELFSQAAQGLYQVVGDLTGVGDLAHYRVALKASSLEYLFHDWLAEILYWFDVRQVIFREFTFPMLRQGALEARLKGQKLDLERSNIHIEIKAVTYHNLQIQREGDELVATVIFDI